MKSAASKTYISKRMIDRYSEQRRLQQSQSTSSGNQPPLLPPKNFSEDNVGAARAQTIPVAASQRSAATSSLTGEPLQPIEEEKKEYLEQTDAQESMRVSGLDVQDEQE